MRYPSRRWIPLVCVVSLATLQAACADGVAPQPERVGAASEAITCVNIFRGGAFGVEDATVATDPTDPSRGATNFGSALTLTTGTFGSTTRSALIRFDVSFIPTQAIVTSATLGLLKASSVGAGAVDVHRVLSPWSEATVTYNGMAGALDPSVSASFVPSSVPNGGPASVDMTSLVSAWVSGALPNNGVWLVQGSAGRATFGASEAGVLNPRPKLTVCYAPTTCADGVQNGAETGVDCGGACPPCGGCAGVTCVAQDACHLVGSCDASTGACSNPIAPFGTPCDDGDACTQVDACQAGTCVGASSVVCSAQDACHAAGVCDPATGTCSNPAAADGAACDDGDACTQVDLCQGGVCSGTALLSGQACSTGLSGVCGSGTTDCTAGAVSCVADAQPIAEVCNGLDDDCDGSVDEGCASCAGVDCESCATVLGAAPGAPDGVYTIDPDGAGPNPAFDVYCDMTSDGGGWTLMATLHTADVFITTSLYGAWSDNWWTLQHGTPTDPNAAFSNHDVRRFKPLVTSNMILRTTTPAASKRRYQFGMSPGDWDLWNQSRTVSAVNVVGPFNLANVLVSTSLSLSNPVIARLNGHWYNGQFYLGTLPGGADADGEGLGARFHVGSNAAPQYGFAADARVDAPWHMWIRENPTCFDGVQNGGEQGVDCEGACAAVCPTCVDGIQNGGEQGIDCGGPCAACPILTCESILAGAPGTADGVYTVDPDGGGPNPPFSAYCDMSTDGGGWTLMATLSTTNTSTPAPSWPWSDNWWTVDHGSPTSTTTAFSNRDARLFKALVDGNFILRVSSPASSVKRYHYGLTPADWDFWNAGRTVSGVNVVGPFNLANVLVSTNSNLTGGVMARSNGHWSSGYFYLGTAPGGADSDSEGLGARFHVATNAPPQYGYCGNVRQNALWHLWAR